jgi:5-formyltetrahydrofolate cyclo-ligase
MDAKNELRMRLRAVRDDTDPVLREKWNAERTLHGVAALREHVQADTVVSAYWPMRSEADPRPLAFALAKLGATLALPIVRPTGMTFREWASAATLVAGGFGTTEPPAVAPLAVPTLVLAPLLAFDLAGNRLGWGKGYYDRALGELDAAAARGEGVRPFVVGVAFACQQVDVVPATATDRRLDAVLTEHGYHHFASPSRR